MSSSHDFQAGTERAAAAAERRRRSRVAGDTQGWIFPATPRLPTHLPGDDEEAWEVRIHDVSRFGVGFISTEPMQLGDEHRLRIGRGPMKRARVIRVVACQRCDDGTFSVGAEFTDSGGKMLSRTG
jgi:hypothetical protein